MKKICLSITAVLVALILFCSCSSQKRVDLTALMSDVDSNFGLTDMTAVESLEELHTLFMIDEDDISQFSAEYSAESDTRQEIILVEAKDKTAAFRVKTTLFNRLDSFLSNSKSYSPEEYAVLEKCKVNVYNDIYVTLVINENAEEIDSYIKENLT
ncbi:MAG: DUF4358 domain-containing protein [Ruminococcus sp.]|nr:DUF4358 domain-containing protein [Ruminococcus sp.]